jgi:hypothetical protein
MAGCFGLSGLYRLAEAVESACHAGAVAEATDLSDGLDTVLAEALAELDDRLAEAFPNRAAAVV